MTSTVFLEFRTAPPSIAHDFPIPFMMRMDLSEPVISLIFDFDDDDMTVSFMSKVR